MSIDLESGDVLRVRLLSLPCVTSVFGSESNSNVELAISKSTDSQFTWILWLHFIRISLIEQDRTFLLNTVS